jgi:hypothetical protein
MTEKALLAAEALAQLDTWYCGGPVLNDKHSRSAFIWTDETRRKRPKIQLCSPEEPCCAVVSVDVQDSVVYALVRPRTDAQHALLTRLDEFAIELVQRKCGEWFGKALTPEHIKGMYRPLIHRECLCLRMPVDACNVWKTSRNGKQYVEGCPRDLRAAGRILPCVTVNGIYFKAREMGLSLTCSDALFFAPAAPLPFHLPAAFETDDSLPEHVEQAAFRAHDEPGCAASSEAPESGGDAGR